MNYSDNVTDCVSLFTQVYVNDIPIKFRKTTCQKPVPLFNICMGACVCVYLPVFTCILPGPCSVVEIIRNLSVNLDQNCCLPSCSSGGSDANRFHSAPVKIQIR